MTADAAQPVDPEVDRLRRALERIAAAAEDMDMFPGMASVAEAARAALAGEDIASEPYVSRYADSRNPDEDEDDEEPSGQHAAAAAAWTNDLSF